MMSQRHKLPWTSSPSGRVDRTAHSLEGPWGGTENGLWVIWALDRAHSRCTQMVFFERKGLSGTILPFLGCKGHFKTASLDGPKVC